MPPVGQKTIELKMVATADVSKASAAMQQLTRDAEKAGMAVKAIHSGGGGSRPGIFESAAGAIAPIAAATGIVATAANLTKAVQNLGSEFLTVREKALGFAAALPIVGDSISRFLGNLMDARDRIFDGERAMLVDRMRNEMPGEMARLSAYSENRMRGFGLNREISEAGYRRQAVGEFPTIASGTALLRGSMGGMAGAFLGVGLDAIDPRLMSAAEGVQGARGRLREAELSAGASSAAVEAARGQARMAMKGMLGASAAGTEALTEAMGGGPAWASHRNRGADAARNRAGGGAFGEVASVAGYAFPSMFGERDGGSNLALSEAMLNLQRQMHTAQLANAELEQKMTANKERQLQLLQRQHELSRAESNLLGARVGVLDEQYAIARGGARQFGAMDDSSQSSVLSALQRFKQFGRQGVTRGEIEQLMGNQLTSNFVGNAIEKDISNDPAYRQILAITGQRDAGTLRQERDQLKRELDIKVQLDEEQFSKLLEEKLKNINLKDLLGELLKNQLEVKLRAPEINRLGARVGG